MYIYALLRLNKDKWTTQKIVSRTFRPVVDNVLERQNVLFMIFYINNNN